MLNIYPLSRKIKVYGRGDETKSRYFMRHQFILPATTTKKLENFYWILSIVSVSAKSTQTHHFRWWRWWWLAGWLNMAEDDEAESFYLQLNKQEKQSIKQFSWKLFQRKECIIKVYPHLLHWKFEIIHPKLPKTRTLLLIPHVRGAMAGKHVSQTLRFFNV